MREEIERALEVLGITPPVSIRRLKDLYRKRVKENRDRIDEISLAYRTLIDFMENYPFRFTEDEVKRAYPEERVRDRFRDLLWGGR